MPTASVPNSLTRSAFRLGPASNGITTLFPKRCLVNEKACWASSQQASFFRIGRAAWIRLLLRASNEHRFFVRVLRARETSQAALLFP